MNDCPMCQGRMRPFLYDDGHRLVEVMKCQDCGYQDRDSRRWDFPEWDAPIEADPAHDGIPF